MKRILRYIAVVATVCVGLAGCGGSHNIDARLALADSLIVDHADSAYTVLKAIDSEELLSESDRAFYALLYTQAQYKNVDSIGSDSLINIALDYYKDNHNREHYTRTLIYKGAVMEELGNPEEALEWYLSAENNAAPDDYLNLGQANLRMAVLYSNNYSDYNLKIQKYTKAENYYYLAQNAQYQLMCLSGLGGSYRICNMDSAYYYLDKALELAKEMGNEGELYSCTEMKVRGMLVDSLHHEAKTLALDYLNTKGTEYVDDDLYYDLASAYIGLGNADSAQYYFDKTTENPQNAEKIVMRLCVQSEIYTIKGLYKESYDKINEVDVFSQNIKEKGMNKSLILQEANYKEEIFTDLKTENIKDNFLNTTLIWTILFILILVIVFSIKIFRSQIKQFVKAQSIIRRLRQEQSKNFIKTQNKQPQLRAIIKKHIRLFKTLYDCSQNYKNNSDKLSQKLSNILKDNQPNDSFFEELRQYVNSTRNQSRDQIINKYPQLTKDDINIITMVCCDLSYLEMTICMGYTNEKYIYKKKKQIINKLNLGVSLEEFCKKHIK